MKTLEITLYSFNELNDKAKDKAINDYLHYANTSYIYYEAENTIKEFCNVFNVSYKNNYFEYTRNNYFDFQINSDSNIMNLTGLRLRKYILNNFSYILFKPKYIKSLKEDKKRVYHTRIKTKTYKNGNILNTYYSAINTENDYNLTGVCYDYDILKPIYEFLEYKDVKRYKYIDYEDLISECFYNLEKVIKAEEEYLMSEPYIIEFFKENEYLFNQEGGIYRYKDLKQTI